MKVIYVDGFKVRQTLDPDFNIVEQGGNFNPQRQFIKPYIPKGEIWFDVQFKRESSFLLAVELRRPSKMPSLKKLSRFVDIERRRQSKRFLKHGAPPPFIKETKKTHALGLRYVDGSIIRQYIDCDFVFGGHDLVYSYIPKNEIWIDIRMDPCDSPHVLVHEETERMLMARDKKGYPVAHEYATLAEKESRRKKGGVYPGDDNFPFTWTLPVLQSYFKGHIKKLP